MRFSLAFALTALAAALGAPASSAVGQETPAGFEAVKIEAPGERAAELTAYLRRPASDKPVPAIVALHGCGGLFTAVGRFSTREADWADRLVAEGYAVLFPDSFNPRGYRQICTIVGTDRPIRPRQRADDAAAAAVWLAQQPFVDAARLALLGWSNGGSTVLAAVDASRNANRAPSFRAAIAFYPGCRPYAGRATWTPAVPLTILIGSADDWTPPEPCRALAGQHAVRLIEYAGAVHGFDAPNSPRRTRTDVGLSARGDGLVEVGTDPVARAAAIETVRGLLADALRGTGVP